MFCGTDRQYHPKMPYFGGRRPLKLFRAEGPKKRQLFQFRQRKTRNLYEEPLRQPLTPPIVKLSSNSLRGVGNIRVFDVETLSSDTELCANNVFFSTGVRSVVNGIEFTAAFATVKMAANFPAIFALVIHRLR